jgi:hypothetical protein
MQIARNPAGMQAGVEGIPDLMIQRLSHLDRETVKSIFRVAPKSHFFIPC